MMEANVLCHICFGIIISTKRCLLLTVHKLYALNGNWLVMKLPFRKSTDHGLKCFESKVHCCMQGMDGGKNPKIIMRQHTFNVENEDSKMKSKSESSKLKS